MSFDRHNGRRASARPGGPRAAAPTRLEPLEPRRLFSTGASIVAGASVAGPRYLTDFNGTLLFRAGDPLHGEEWWRSDGTAAGTRIIKDVNPGPAASNPGQVGYFPGNDPGEFRTVGPTFFFAARDGSAGGASLWKSDGTEAGTVRVRAFSQEGTRPWPLTAVNGALYFTASTSSTGVELWRSDGTEFGTYMVGDIRPGVAASDPRDLTAVGDTLYFTAADADGHRELWKSDGTPFGTVRVKDIWPGVGSSPTELTNVNGTLFFSAQGPSQGRELYRSDGTAAGTVLVKEIRPGVGGANPEELTAVGDTLFFRASGWELWKSDGSAAGTVRVAPPDPAAAQHVRNLTASGRVLYFTADDGAAGGGNELYRSDGTAAGTYRVKDIAPATANGNSSDPQYLTDVGGTLYFTAWTADAGRELWRSDGTAEGTVLARDIRPGGEGSVPLWLVNAGGTLYYTADDGAHGRALWRAPAAPARVIGRHVFYNNSAFDGHGPGPGAADDGAIAADKSALLPGRAASPAHVTSYARGINGVMVDLAGPHDAAALSAADFDARTFDGRRWSPAPAPLVSVRYGAGASGSDRVTLTWPDGAFTNTWLRVTVKANDRTGLTTDDVFSFGNLVGDTGGRAPGAVASVNPFDLLRTRRALGTTASVTDPHDHNRDGRVTAVDYALARANQSRALSSLAALPAALAPTWNETVTSLTEDVLA
jgi:ELWxxDGT repeat protein